MELIFAQELARRGYNVLAVARRRDRLEALARNESSRGGRILPFTADLGTSDGLAALAARVRELGNIDLLVNNAGVATAGNFADSDL
jgi:short-subunit dehydrogenase